MSGRRASGGQVVLAGCDEAGRGPWAGPVVAAAVILRSGWRHPRLDDSKRIGSERLREEIALEIMRSARAWSTGAASAGEIDRLNVLRATFLAMRRAVHGLGLRPGLLLVDGPHPIPRLGCPQRALVRGDARSASIAAASVLAKVTRDRIMRELHARYPQYGFHLSKGYGTSAHRAALHRWGPSPIHRMTYRPVQNPG